MQKTVNDKCVTYLKICRHICKCTFEPLVPTRVEYALNRL